MNKKVIITILLALVTMTGLAQTFTWRIEGTVANAAPTDTLNIIDTEKQRKIATLQVKDGNIIPEQRLLDEGLITETRAETEKRLNAIFNPPKTNYRKIIASPETLAEFIAEDRKQCHQANCGAECDGCTKEGVLRWLKQVSDTE